MRAIRQWFVVSTLAISACSTPSVQSDASRDTSVVDVASDARTDASVDSAVPDASSEPDGFDAPDAPARCTGATADECDDRDPRTTDSCLGGQCAHFECTSDADCDDADPSTVDTCQQFPEALRTSCAHTLGAYRCHVDADCNDSVDCTTEHCVDTVCHFTWPASCALTCTPIRSCGAGEVVGAPCGSLPVAPGSCVATAGTCPVFNICGGNFEAGYAAGSACPSNPCPVDPPAAGTACPAAPITCDYGTDPLHSCNTGDLGPSGVTGSHPAGHPMCECRPGSTWDCQIDRCPLLPPNDGDVGPPRVGSYPSCNYRNYRCDLRVDAPGSSTNHWRCYYPRACVFPAPADGSSCDHTQDDYCSYMRDSAAQPVTQYTGSCTCGADNLWHCDANEAAACPSTLPDTHSGLPVSCVQSIGNSQCLYYEADTAPMPHRCQCSPNIWQCSP